MQVQYRETKGGFECIHLPSIDISSVDGPSSAIDGHSTPTHKPSIVKKASKLSFRLRRDKGKEREPSTDKEYKDKEREIPSRPSGATTLTATPSSGSSSFFNVASTHTVIQQPENNANGVSPPSDSSPPRHSPASNKAKILPPIPRDFGAAPSSPRSPSPMPTGEVDRDVFESMGNNTLSVRFEINIVKVGVPNNYVCLIG